MTESNDIIEAIVQFIAKILVTLIDAEPADLQTLRNDPNVASLVSKFATDSQIPVLFAIKTLIQGLNLFIFNQIPIV